jgi:hypothetical protein
MFMVFMKKKPGKRPFHPYPNRNNLSASTLVALVPPALKSKPAGQPSANICDIAG